MTISIGEIDTVGRSNIIGQKVVATGTVRAINDDVMNDTNVRLNRVVVNAAEMHGLTATLQVDQHTKFDEKGNVVAAKRGGGPIPNHNPAFYIDDAALKTGVRLEAYVAMDYLSGK